MRLENILSALRAFTARRTPSGPVVREGLRLGWTVVRRRPDVVLAAGLVVGVLVMILHWS